MHYALAELNTFVEHFFANHVKLKLLRIKQNYFVNVSKQVMKRSSLIRKREMND